MTIWRYQKVFSVIFLPFALFFCQRKHPKVDFFPFYSFLIQPKNLTVTVDASKLARNIFPTPIYYMLKKSECCLTNISARTVASSKIAFLRTKSFDAGMREKII